MTISTKIIQIPTKDNGFLAIVQSEQVSPQGSSKDFGTATAMSTNTENIKNIIESARDEALKRFSPQANVATVSTTQFTAPSSNQVKVYNHSPDRLMSDKQERALRNMSQEKNINLENLARQTLGKSSQDLSSADANTLMQQIRNTR